VIFIFDIEDEAGISFKVLRGSDPVAPVSVSHQSRSI